MTVDHESLKELMLARFDALEQQLEMRKTYWDTKIGQICKTVDEMKHHCEQQESQCGKVFEWYDKRLNEWERQVSENKNEIGKIKTVGGIAVILWGGVVAFAKHIIAKLGG